LIKVTKLSGIEYLLNPHMIESIERNPDTTITLLSGKKIIVKESPDQVYDEIVTYRKKLGISGNEE
jgi:flagellar protein FlbD